MFVDDYWTGTESVRLAAPMAERRWAAGDSVDDLCRVCKDVRRHTVLAADNGVILRVVCAHCMSAHRYRRGGPDGDGAPKSAHARASAADNGAPRTGERAAFPMVSERERSAPRMSIESSSELDIEVLLRRIIREESGLTPVTPADRWREGTMVLRPGKPGLAEKTIPIETFFHKIVMLRNRLRVLEQQVNASKLPEDEKVKLQGYITGCYGSLTTFNILFADEDDKFSGSGGEG